MAFVQFFKLDSIIDNIFQTFKHFQKIKIIVILNLFQDLLLRHCERSAAIFISAKQRADGSLQLKPDNYLSWLSGAGENKNTTHLAPTGRDHKTYDLRSSCFIERGK